MSRLLTLKADFQTDLDAIRSMYGHDSVLTGKAISAVLGEKRGRLKEMIKAYLDKKRKWPTTIFGNWPSSFQRS